jgi:soluble lytic murein transglycosylase-like protein
VANNIKSFFLITASTIVIAFVFLFVTPDTSLAEIYYFTDARGVVHYTNVRTDPRYKLLPGIISFSRPFSRNRPRTQSYGDTSFDAHIQEAALRYDIDPMLIKAVIKQESNFNPNATSEKGALGLMQLMPGTARDMNVVDVFNPRDNILGGARYLKRLYSQFNGNLALTLASYNAGPEKVYSTNGIPDIPETKDYVRTVLFLYDKYRRYE